jgi:hypothetical protein
MALAHLFPDKFTAGIPLPFVALSVACVSSQLSSKTILIYTLQLACCLLEYADTGVQQNIKFEAGRFQPVYLTAIAYMEEIDRDPYHGPKMRRTHRRWAQKGM